MINPAAACRIARPKTSRVKRHPEFAMISLFEALTFVRENSCSIKRSVSLNRNASEHAIVRVAAE